LQLVTFEIFLLKRLNVQSYTEAEQLPCRKTIKNGTTTKQRVTV
jgi:hypothetical protein